MAESASEKPQKYDVFLCHSSEDNAKALQINKALREAKLHTWAHYKEGNEFDIGKSVFDNIRRAVELSDIVLILVTKNALESSWVTFEMLLSFEKSDREQFMCARLVFEGVSEEEKKKFMTGSLELIPSVTIDFNKDNWEKELVAKVKEQVPMKEILPAGNVAVGLVYNYFVGYLRIILPELAKASKESEYYNERRMFKKLLLLVPDSCKIPRLECDSGDYIIKKMEKSLVIQKAHGDKMRSYNPAVYSISYKDSEPYYFLGECPFILETMSKINEGKFADIDLRFQVNRFNLTMMEVMNHRGNQECHNTIHSIAYHDEGTGVPPVEEIWNTLKQELEPSGPKLEIKIHSGKKDDQQDGEEYFATVSNSDSSNDKRVASKVIGCLEDKKVKFTNGDGNFEPRMLEKASFNIFVVSADSVKEPDFKKLYDDALERSVTDNRVKVISVVTKGTDLKTLPQNFTWITVLKEEEPDFLTKLWDAMHRETRTEEKKEMVECIPVGKVYEGLSYAYLLNYLGLAVTGNTAEGRGFRQRFEDAMKKYNCGCLCVARVFVIVPKSCTFPPPGSQFKDEEHLGGIEPVVMGFRKYFLQMYRLTLSDGQKVCYAREYATPAITLHEMAHTIPFSGLTKAAMNDQALHFSKFVTDIIHNETFKQQVQNLEDKVTMVYFDDEPDNAAGVTKALEKKLTQCLANKDYINWE